MMNWIMAITIGALVGLIYFGGLWLTVRQVIGGRRGVGLVFISRLARMVLFGAVFYWLSRRSAGQAMAGFGGFWSARWYLLLRLGGGSDGK
jgi:F1F0 ATPase subunit 2